MAGGTSAAASPMLHPFSVTRLRNGNVQGTAVADANRYPDRADVGSLHPRSHHRARTDGRHGQPGAQRQATIGLGTAALFRPHQRRRKPDHLCAAGADSRCARLFDGRHCDRLRGLFLGSAGTCGRLHDGRAGPAHPRLCRRFRGTSQRSHWRCSENSNWRALRVRRSRGDRSLAAKGRRPTRPRRRGGTRKTRLPPQPAHA